MVHACKRTTWDYLAFVLDTLLEAHLRLQVLLGLCNIIYVQTQVTLVLISIKYPRLLADFAQYKYICYTAIVCISAAILE